MGADSERSGIPPEPGGHRTSVRDEQGGDALELDAAPRILALLLVATVGMLGIAVVSGWSELEQSQAHFRRIAHVMGRAFFQELVLTRRWNANHGGVYVWRTDEVQPNRFLIDSERDLELPDGRQLTKINPAYMTRLISELAEQEAGVRFHMTSLKPLNPGNAADTWEAASLTSFEAGAEETFAVHSIEGEERARYMGRLLVEEECMKCHAAQGYETGMVRGGISISYPFTAFRDGIANARRRTLWLHGGFLSIGLALLWGLGLRLRRNVIHIARTNLEMRELNEELENTVITDALTGVRNRLYVDRALAAEIHRAERYGVDVAVAMIDADLFKRINDEHGHHTGDAVLRELAQLLARNARATDHLARWGGEEFLVVAPHADRDQIRQVAEKFRSLVEQTPFAGGCRMTISVGIAQLEPGEGAEALLRRADAALYRAKSAGRNRVAS